MTFLRSTVLSGKLENSDVLPPGGRVCAPPASAPAAWMSHQVRQPGNLIDLQVRGRDACVRACVRAPVCPHLCARTCVCLAPGP